MVNLEKKLNIWNDYQNQKNYDLSFNSVDDNAPDHIVLKETKDDRGKNGEQWNFKIVSKDYIDTKNAEQDETARQQQAQITEHDHKIREQEEKIVKIEEKNTEQDGKISELETKNTEQDGKISELENKNSEQDNKLLEHENRLEQLDGGHTSNLGKIGEIETKLDDHSGRLDLLETETETYSTRVFKKSLTPLELKLDNILSLVKVTISIFIKTGETFTSHLTGLYVVDKKNNHNNYLSLFTDTIDNEKFYHIEISGDESFLLKIIHTKNIEIKNVLITEYSQTLLELPNLDGVDERLLPKTYSSYIFSGFNSGNYTYYARIFSSSIYFKYSEYTIWLDLNATIHLVIKKLDEYDGFIIELDEYINRFLAKEKIPRFLNGNFTTEHLLRSGGFILINNSEIAQAELMSEGRTIERFEDLNYKIDKKYFKEGVNIITFRLGYLYNMLSEKID